MNSGEGARPSKLFSSGTKRLHFRLCHFAFVLVLAGAFATAPRASGQGSIGGGVFSTSSPPANVEIVTWTNYPPYTLTPVPPLIILPFPDDPFNNGVVLTGAPVVVAGTNQILIPLTISTVLWWHWTAPADGVADLNVGPLYAFRYVLGINQPPVPIYDTSQTWPAISVGPDRYSLAQVPLLPFSQTTAIGYSLFPSSAFPPLYLPEDRTLWQHKFRFPVTAGEVYHIALTCTGIGPYQFDIDLMPVGLLMVPTGNTNPVAGDPFPFEFISTDSNQPVVSLEAFAGTNSLGVLTNGPFQFVYTASQSGVVPIYALGTNSSGEKVVAYPVQVAFRPANDDFARATVIPDSLTQGTFSVNASSATAEPGEPELSPGMPASHSVWWRWTPRYGVRTVVTLTSASSTLAVYKGDEIGALERVLTLANAPGVPWPPIIIFPPTAANSSGSFLAEPGMTYYIRADGGGVVSWSVEQQTLEFFPAVVQRGNVGLPLDFSAIFYETDRPPFQVEFILGQQIWHPWNAPQLQVIATLGSLGAPPFFGSWTPTNVGPFFIWARSTNCDGNVLETRPTEFDIYAENDDFLRATVIPSATTGTNYLFNNSWTSAEPGEPPHKKAVACHTRWWKWTPAHSQNVRLKATCNLAGFPLDVFKGTSLSDLRRLAGNDEHVYLPGYSGSVRLAVKAGQTYFIRTDDTRVIPVFPGSAEPPPDVLLTLESTRAPLPGEVNFSLIAGALRGRNGTVRVIPVARVYQTDRRTPLAGSQYRAQLYAGPTMAGLQPVGTPQPFFDSSNSSFAGLFLPAPVVLPDTAPGRRCFVQICVWDASYGETFEQARANGSPFGSSGVIGVTAGSEDTGPSVLWGIHSFSLR